MKTDRQYYILLASEQMNNEGKLVSASVVFNKLITRGKWFLSEATPFRRVFQSGDFILFYLAGPKHRYFAGTATVASEAKQISSQDQAMLAQLGLYGFTEELPLEEIVVWEKSKPILPLVEKLTFIKDKKNYGLNLRQGAVRINEADYETIVTAS